jgi:hypothetical protein
MIRAHRAMSGGAARAAINRGLIAALSGIVLIGAGTLAWMRYRDLSITQAEAELQKPEIEECRKRLASVATAWKRFAADHKGHEPGSFKDLVPKYISDPKILMCPTAERWISKGTAIQSGMLDVNGKKWRVTYGFLAFTASYPIELAKFGDSTVLVSCDSHQDGMYRSLYHHSPPPSVFEGTQRAGLPDGVRDAKQLVLRKNGSVDVQAEPQ